MRRFMIALMFVCFGTFAAAQSEEIEGTIRSQMDAFLQDDFDTAFSFASPSIKGIFGSPENFGRMVREGYPMVWRPDDVEFGSLREENGRLRQRVTVIDGAGRAHALDYDMIETPDGWQINGVELIRAQGIGV